MNFKLLQSSFVGIWEKPLNNLPPLNRKLLLDIFEDPYYTNIGFGPEGLIISHLSDNPRGNIILNSGRIQISSFSHDTTSKMIIQIYQTMRDIIGIDFHYPYSSIGINTEFEVSGILPSSKEWLNKVYFQKFKNFLDEDVDIQPYHVRFDLKLKNGLKINLLIQPSISDETGLIFSLNDDKFWSEKAHPTQEQLMDYYLESNLEFTNRFKKLLNLS